MVIPDTDCTNVLAMKYNKSNHPALLVITSTNGYSKEAQRNDHNEEIRLSRDFNGVEQTLIMKLIEMILVEYLLSYQKNT